MQLSGTQRKISFVAIALIFVMLLFPPWNDTWGSNSNFSDAGYHFIAAPPPSGFDDIRGGVRIDMLRLLLQCLAVGATGGLADWR